MECTKWEQIGLLYCAGELDRRTVPEYEGHLKVCAACRTEVDSYRHNCEHFFSPELLAASPSPEIDAEILRVCSMPMKRASGVALFPLFLRKAAVPLVLFMIAFFADGYVKFNAENARQLKAASVVVPVSAPVAENSGTDSLNDSMSNSKANYARTRGNLNDQGVITVDLKEK